LWLVLKESGLDYGPNYELESIIEEFLKPNPNDAHLMAESAI